ASNLYLQPLSDKYDFTQVSFVCSHWAVHNYTPRFGLCLEQMWVMEYQTRQWFSSDQL
ncbi:unnamed protein product, partial [Brassica napus]